MFKLFSGSVSFDNIYDTNENEPSTVQETAAASNLRSDEGMVSMYKLRL